MRSDETIIDRGRGPEIKGTRITVFDVLDYLLVGWAPARIAAWLGVSTDQVQAAVDYIEERRIEVLRDYLTILDACAAATRRKFRRASRAGTRAFRNW